MNRFLLLTILGLLGVVGLIAFLWVVGRIFLTGGLSPACTKYLQGATLFFAVGMIAAAIGCIIARSLYIKEDKQFQDWTSRQCTVESYIVRSSRVGDKCEAHTMVGYSYGINETCTGLYLVAPKFLDSGKYEEATHSGCDGERNITDCVTPPNECKNPLAGTSNEPFCTVDSAKGTARNCDELLSTFLVLFILGIVFTSFVFVCADFCACNCFRTWQILADPWNGGLCGTYPFSVKEFEQLQGVYKCGDTQKVVMLKSGEKEVDANSELIVVTSPSGADTKITYLYGVITHGAHRLVYSDDVDHPIWQDENLGRVLWHRQDEEELGLHRLPSYEVAIRNGSHPAPNAPPVQVDDMRDVNI